jgi:hypothetical protein
VCASNCAGGGTCEVLGFYWYKHAFHYFTSPRASKVAGEYGCAIDHYYNYKRTEYLFDIRFDVSVC